MKIQMKEEFIVIQASLGCTFWNIEISLTQTMKNYSIIDIDGSLEQLFAHLSDCFNSKQVRIETVDSLMYFNFTQHVGIEEVSFIITLKQGDLNIQ